MKKWIFFDIDNTLFYSREHSEHARKNAIQAMIKRGLKASEKEAYEELVKIVERLGSNSDAHFNELVKKFNGVADWDIVTAGVVAYQEVAKYYLKPYSGVVRTLEELKKRGHRLGVISNGRSVKQREKLIKLGLQEFFEVVVISEDIGVRKPEKEIFEKALELAKCSARDAIMVGDKESDIKPAKELGMVTVSSGECGADYKIDSHRFEEMLGVIDEIGD
ncbi:MAG: TIGR02253 family HAD-type hydrolase [archaeon]